MNHYEVLYIINDTIDDTAKKEIVTRFSDLVTENGGKVNQIDLWGRRRLAYPIRFMTEGYYVLMAFDAEPELPAELERNLRISSENVLRFMVSRIPDGFESKLEMPEEPEEVAEAEEAVEETAEEAAEEVAETVEATEEAAE